jgi:hypothetical protein
MQMWLWTLQRLQSVTDADGGKLYHSSRQGVTFPLADALCFLLGSRAQILDLIELEKKGPQNPTVAEGLPGMLTFLSDLCHVQAARAAGEVGRICAELVFGYNRHPAWDTEGCGTCYRVDDLEILEGLIPGIVSAACGVTDIIESDGSHPAKAGPCVRFEGLDQFARLRVRLDGCLTGVATGERSRRGSAHQGDDSGSGELSGMSGDVERQSMDVDIACVGFGPATAGFLASLSKSLVNPDGSPRHRESRDARAAAAGGVLRTRGRRRVRRLRHCDARPRHSRIAARARFQPDSDGRSGGG